MAGIYIHIPFCRKACHYCNFHFSTSFKKKNLLVEAILKEIEKRASFFGNDEELGTIYFGGGTPSVLSSEELESILKQCYSHFSFADDVEITLEANPDDLESSYLADLRSININRLSIGIQSFHEEALKWMNRSHNATQAKQCVINAKKEGFENMSLDLIYGIPKELGRNWESDIQMALELDITHYSCYALTVEEKTPLEVHIRQNKSPAVDLELQSEEFEILMKQMKEHGFDHYEISNFAKSGHESRHNSSYWNGEKYLGIGPAAHSYDGTNRYWNISHNPKYIESMSSGSNILTQEVLSAQDRYNEWVMTSLRRKEGCTKKNLQEHAKEYQDYFNHRITRWIRDGYVILQDHSHVLNTSGKHFADRIASDLFYVN